MYEVPLASGRPLAPAPETLSFQDAKAVYFGRLAEQSGQIPEVADRQEFIGIAGAEIIDRFAIEPRLFEDSGRSFVFTAIASRWSGSKDTGNAGEDSSERVFLTDALTLLADEYSPVLKTAKISPEPEDKPLDIDDRLPVFEKYTHQALSRELAGRIDEGLLDEVKGRLGITPGQEEPFEVRVLAIDPGGQTGIGIAGRRTPWKDMPGDDRAKRRQVQQETARNQEIQTQFRDLAEQSRKMGAELGLSRVAIAWVIHRSPGAGPKLMYIPQPLAQKILYPDLLPTSRFYSKASRMRDFAVLEHEYVHTQKGIHINPVFGRNVAELVAEHYSGNMQDYDDIIGFFDDIKILAGCDVIDMLEGQEQDDDKSSVYFGMANCLGLDATLEALLAAPRNFSANNPHWQACLDYIGGYDGVLRRLLEAQTAKGNQPLIERRLAESMDQLEAAPKDPWTTTRSLIHRRKLLGLYAVTDLMLARLTATGNR